MAKFTENKAKNISTGYTSFEYKYGYKACVFLSMKLICVRNPAL